MIRLLWILGCIAAGGVSACYAQPYVARNSDIVLIIVTVYSVFAGFLVAVITIIGDPIMIREGSWRIAELGRDSMQRRLIWHIVLFTLYLFTIGLLFVGVVLEKALDDDHGHLKAIVETSYLFFGITSFLLTFALSAGLLRIQQARYDAEIERRRQKAKIGSNRSCNNIQQ